MDMLSEPVLLLALAMFLAIGIERLMELNRALFDHLEAHRGTADRWQKRAEALRDRIELRLDNAATGPEKVFKAVLSVVCRYLSPTDAETGTAIASGDPGLFAIKVDRVREMSVRIFYKLLGIALGIALAFVFNLNIFELVDKALAASVAAGASPTPAPAEPMSPAMFLGGLDGRAWWGTVLSGMAMGFGAGPVHKLIVALEDARRLRK
jgi:hypothetical protein